MTSVTNVSFFDINYKTILKMIIKNENISELSTHSELQLLHQNIELFSQLFGFKFDEHKSINQINNQSLVQLENIYP